MSDTFIRFPELAPRGINYTRQHINRLMAKGLFPQAVWLGPNYRCWRLSDIERFEADRPTVRPRPEAPVHAG